MTAPKFPRWFPIALALLGMATTIPFAVFAYARHSKSQKPRIHIIRDMDNQERFKAQQENDLFADGRAMRPPIPGTVARGELRLDDHLHRGQVGGAWVTSYPARDAEGRPIELNEALFERGRERYQIFCAVCHGRSGYGDGPVDRRAKLLMSNGAKDVVWAQPANLHAESTRAKPVGEIFNTVSNGYQHMAGYKSQIPVRDRWAIVFYVKVLQRSHHPE